MSIEDLTANKIRPIDLDEARELIDEIEHSDDPGKSVIELNGDFYDISLATPESVLELIKLAKPAPRGNKD